MKTFKIDISTNPTDKTTITIKNAKNEDMIKDMLKVAILNLSKQNSAQIDKVISLILKDLRGCSYTHRHFYNVLIQVTKLK